MAFPRPLASAASVCLAAGGLAVGACGRSAPEPPPPAEHHHAMGAEGSTAAPVPAEPTPVNGGERFGWTVPAGVAGRRFAVYANGNRIELPGAVCHPPSSGQVECDSPLPSLVNGKHTLEVVSWIMDDHGQVVESAKSPPILIVMSGSGAGVAPPKSR